MSEEIQGTSTRRNVLQKIAVGSGVVGGVVAGGAGVASAADCPSDSFCYGTTEEAEAYDKCPADALSYVTTIEAGRAGTLQDTCTDEYGNCYVKIRFDCSEEWWFDAAQIEAVNDTKCTC